MGRQRPYKRTDRIGKQVQEVLAIALQRETREDCLRNVVVTGVDVTRDLSLARVYYYLMGGNPAEVNAALDRAQGFLRTRVGQEIRMRQTPELRFLFDESIERGRRVEAILSEIRVDDGDPDADSGEDG